MIQHVVWKREHKQGIFSVSQILSLELGARFYFVPTWECNQGKGNKSASSQLIWFE